MVNLITLDEAEHEALEFLGGAVRDREAVGDLLAILADMGAGGVTKDTPAFQVVNASLEIGTIRHDQAHIVSVVARKTEGKQVTIALVLMRKCMTGPQINQAISDGLLRLTKESWI